ncbi:hypothetical protein [Streptosporangium subroseum]|uniref:hypothetical protein n=1 Tax=Streptosporangium subroseum TaxID=106412 RepID=UPI00308EA92B|nr:hypothetical protein OHB15_08270 [Streptosporangium subroseum]
MKKIRVALLALMVAGALVGANAALADGTEPDPDFGVQDSHWMEPSEPPETPAPPAPSPDPSPETPAPPAPSPDPSTETPVSPAPSPDPSTGTPAPSAPSPDPSEGTAPEDPYEDWEPPPIPPKEWTPKDSWEGNP